jgi:lipopolysaccharide/colanic/teichoic acid biosynthesis glycosyltransferase
MWSKRLLDLVLTMTILILLAIPVLVIALAIFASDPRAPVLYRQRRCGRGGETFVLLKFRTMVRGADALKEQLRHRSEVPWPDFRLTDDPRVTRLGRRLRATSLDELPQLLNVLAGHMSLVGPRPTSFASSTYDLWQTERLEHRPGITGPWQVWGRTSMDFPERCRLEIAYFRKPSVLADLRVLAATLLAVVRRTGVA